MRIKFSLAMRATMAFAVILCLTVLASRLRADTGTCGGQSTTLPFTDVPSSNIFFCAIAEAFFSGLTNGTSATTYAPAANVPREQMAAFITRTLEQSLRRSSPRAALNQWWRPNERRVYFTLVGDDPKQIQSDGTDLWVANSASDTVSRVSGANKSVIQTWTGANDAFGVAISQRDIYVTGASAPGKIYRILPDAPGAVVTVTSSVGNFPAGIAFDGDRLWTGNLGSISIVATSGGSVTTVSTGFSRPLGVIFDGDNIWVTDTGDNTLKKLDSNGAILQTIAVGNSPGYPTFDGINIWVPNTVSGTVSIVRVKDASGAPLPPPPAANAPFVLATRFGNSGAISAAFDGEHVIVVGGSSFKIYKAADLTQVSGGGFSSVALFGVASDGPGFYGTAVVSGSGQVVLF